MLCALTVRTLKPGMFAQFREAFLAGADMSNPPPGWVRFNMVRNAENPDEVVTFGFFDGTVEQLRASAAETGYADMLAAIAPYVAGVGREGLFEIVEDFPRSPNVRSPRAPVSEWATAACSLQTVAMRRPRSGQ